MRARRVKDVMEIYGVFGGYDFVVRVETKTLEDLGDIVADCIMGTAGVPATEALIIGF